MRFLLLLLLLLDVIFFQNNKPKSNDVHIKTMLQGCWKQQSDSNRFMCINANSVIFYLKCIHEDSGSLIYEFPQNAERFYDNQRKAYDLSGGREFNFDFKIHKISQHNDTINLGSILYLDKNNLEIAYSTGSVSFKRVDKKNCW